MSLIAKQQIWNWYSSRCLTCKTFFILLARTKVVCKKIRKVFNLCLSKGANPDSLSSAGSARFLKCASKKTPPDYIKKQCIYKIDLLPSAQVSPPKPLGHWHSKLSPRLVHVPPLRQGRLSQGLGAIGFTGKQKSNLVIVSRDACLRLRH